MGRFCETGASVMRAVPISWTYPMNQLTHELDRVGIQALYVFLLVPIHHALLPVRHGGSRRIKLVLQRKRFHPVPVSAVDTADGSDHRADVPIPQTVTYEKNGAIFE